MNRRISLLSLFVIMVCVVLGSYGSILATDLYVDDNGPGDYWPGDPNTGDPLEDGSLAHPFDSIQEAIDIADAGDTVIVADGIYTGLGNREIDFRGRAITVRSESGTEGCIIDCQGKGRGFYFHSNEGNQSVLKGFTIINGTPTIADPAGNRGGGVYIYVAAPTVINCVFKDNQALYGGGIYNYGGYSAETDPVILAGCKFIENHGLERGGGIYNEYGLLEMDRCEIYGNHAIRGGGMCSILPDRVSVLNSIFSGNVGNESGGGIYNHFQSELALDNCTFAANQATNWAGGIYQGGPSGLEPKINSCIFWGNAVSGVTGEYGCQIYGSAAVSFSCVESTSYSIHYITDNPRFGRDPNDGGDGWGVGDNDDYGDLHLQRSSPCVNAGDPIMAAGPNNLDIDQQPRIMDLRVDMGADEVAMSNLIVNTPKGGEVWAAGSRHEIEWESYNYSGTVDITYSINNGQDWLTLENNVEDTGSYQWILPQVDARHCLVLVTASEPPEYIRYRQCPATFAIRPYEPGAAVSSAWPSLGNNFQRRGLSDYPGAQLGYVKWQFTADGLLYNSIAVGADDQVHIIDENGKLYTLDPNGVLQWSYEITELATEGLAAYWKLDEDDGTTAYDMVGNFHGTVHGDPNWQPTAGRIDGGLEFYGSATKDYISTAEVLNPADGPFSVFAWIKTAPGLTAKGILSQESGRAWLNLNGQGYFTTHLQALGVGGLASDVCINDGLWHHVGFVWDGKRRHLYVDGLNVARDYFSVDGLEPGAGGLYIGRYYIDEGDDRYWDGLIDDVRIYNRALYDWEIPVSKMRLALGSPAVGPDGTIYVGTQRGRFYAIDKDGQARWTHDGGGAIYSTAAVGESGRIYVGSQDGTVTALDPNGCELWRYSWSGPSPTAGKILAPLTIGTDGSVYVGATDDARLRALNPDTGAVQWTCDTGSGGIFTAPPAAADGTVYVAPLYDPNLYAINPADGEILWAADLSVVDPAWLEPGIVEDQEYIKNTYRWYCLTEPAIGPDGAIYVSFDDQYLRAVNPDGSIKWIKPVGVTGGLSLAVGADGLIYAAGDDQTLYVLNDTGEVVSQFTGSGALGYPVIGRDGTIYICDSDHTLWAIDKRQNPAETIDLRRPADLNSDGVFNLLDLELLIRHWPEQNEYWQGGHLIEQIYLEGDINRDLHIDLSDFAILGYFWLLIY